MPSNTPPRRRSPEVARLLRARTHRTQVLRRRITALSLILLVGMWAAVYGLGSLGASTQPTAAAALADVRTTKAATTHVRATTPHRVTPSTAVAHTAAVKTTTTAATTSATQTASAPATTAQTTTAAASTQASGSSSTTAVTTSQS
jgi:hypothetical protein